MLLQQTPFRETHCENPEAEPYVGRDGVGKAFSLKLSSYRPEWQHLILGGRKCFIGPCQIRSGLLLPLTCKKANSWHQAGNRRWSTHWIYVDRIVWLHSYMMSGKRWSFRILCKQFWWWPNELSQIAWHLHDQQLTLGQFVLLPMQTWKWNTFKMFQMSTMFVSHPVKIKAMQVCRSHVDKLCRMAIHRLAVFLFASCHYRWISRVFGAASIPVIFARAIGMWLSHSIEWSPERLTSNSVQSNS